MPCYFSTERLIKKNQGYLLAVTRLVEMKPAETYVQLIRQKNDTLSPFEAFCKLDVARKKKSLNAC